MRTLFILLITLGSQQLFAQESKFITATSADEKYSIDHLKNWTVQFQKEGNEILVNIPLKNLDNIPAKIYLNKEDNLLKDFTLDLYTSRNTALITQFLNATTNENGSTTINGVNANWISYTYTRHETLFAGITYLFILNNSAYQLTISGPESDVKGMEVLFREAAESLTVK